MSEPKKYVIFLSNGEAWSVTRDHPPTATEAEELMQSIDRYSGPRDQVLRLERKATPPSVVNIIGWEVVLPE